jgi:hypothetical protein
LPDIAYASPPNLIAQAQVKGLVQGLNLDPSQVFVSIIPALDPGFEGDLQIQVVPGAVRPYGNGEGAQFGGALLRRQTFSHVAFYRCKLDQHGRTDKTLTENGLGILDLFWRMYWVFAQTYLAVGPNEVPLLMEQMFYEGESPTTIVDAENGLFQRSILWGCSYGLTQPDQVTYIAGNLP